MRFLVLVALLSSVAFAGPSETDCQYYQEIENAHQCGPRGYAMNFGYRLCEKYLKAQPRTTENVQAWFPKVRLCLQQYLEETNGLFTTCKDLKSRALESHLACYLSTGFCELNKHDRRQILRITGK